LNIDRKTPIPLERDGRSVTTNRAPLNVAPDTSDNYRISEAELEQHRYQWRQQMQARKNRPYIDSLMYPGYWRETRRERRDLRRLTSE